jgi:hypothetical protein
MSPKPLVWINGYPGTGKLTIAKFLTKRLLGNDKAMLIHNHILIDPIAWCFGNPIKEPEWYRIRHALRAGLFENYVKNPSELHKTIVFTGAFRKPKATIRPLQTPRPIYSTTLTVSRLRKEHQRRPIFFARIQRRRRERRARILTHILEH